MTGYFITGFAAGIAIAIIFIIGRVYNYKKEANLARRNIDRLERFNSDLQFKLKNVGRSNEVPGFSL
jgi:hypothetical protein